MYTLLAIIAAGLLIGLGIWFHRWGLTRGGAADAERDEDRRHH
ncbi:hypothetical protein [Roseospirillum parvum]|uniref:Uncharacterized protein n=1 Tax=Roseospirillum parvum TaxID=83401 RepID=A0A1G7YKE9_9PROT|nr:hypothetical protein [Roseospirillum parvum]SDG96775.1 hypothetical protein SAMN05421742_103328 [Roseospirillum parvum]